MFAFLLSLIPMFLIPVALVYQYRILKNKGIDINKNLLNKRMGINCYSCSCDMGLTSEEVYKKYSSMKDCLKLCKICNRDNNINGVLSNNYKLYFKKLIFSRKFEKFLLIFVALVVPLSIIGFFMHTTYVSATGSIFMINYWVFVLYRSYLCKK